MDTAALEAVAREFAQLSGDLTHDGTLHEAAPAPDQPSGPCPPTADPVLNVGQKLTNTVFDITFLVSNRNLTACIDSQHNHGFVLAPTGSWSF